MKAKQLIESWKNADTNRPSESPVSNVDVHESMMESISGGINSAGMICTVSGECNSSGRSCWAALGDLLGL